MMNRRAFFGALTGIAAIAALDPEKLLWVPGKKLISIPRRAARPFLAVGDIVQFKGWLGKYVVTEEAELLADVSAARFAFLPSAHPPLRRVFPPPRLTLDDRGHGLSER